METRISLPQLPHPRISLVLFPPGLIGRKDGIT